MLQKVVLDIATRFLAVIWRQFHQHDDKNTWVGKKNNGIDDQKEKDTFNGIDDQKEKGTFNIF